MNPGRGTSGKMTPYNTEQELQIKIMWINRERENADTSQNESLYKKIAFATKDILVTGYTDLQCYMGTTEACYRNPDA